MSKPKLSDYIDEDHALMHDLAMTERSYQSIADIITHVLAEREGAALRELRERAVAFFDGDRVKLLDNGPATRAYNQACANHATWVLSRIDELLARQPQEPPAPAAAPAPAPTAGVTEATIAVLDEAARVAWRTANTSDKAIRLVRDGLQAAQERDALKAEVTCFRSSIDEAAAAADCAPHDVAGRVRALKAEVERLRAVLDRACEAAGGLMPEKGRFRHDMLADRIASMHALVDQLRADQAAVARRELEALRETCNEWANLHPSMNDNGPLQGGVLAMQGMVLRIDRILAALQPAPAAPAAETPRPSDEPDDLVAAIMDLRVSNAVLRSRVEALERERKGGGK